jgi:uncharacterized membrane protein YuzA (DUF378 family)
MNLMEIVDEPNLTIQLKQAALIQLKNLIKVRWKPKKTWLQLSEAEREQIRNTLVLAIIRCAKNHLLIKLYREILTTVIGYDYETWTPLPYILVCLRAGENLCAVFQCMIAISSNFEFIMNEK